MGWARRVPRLGHGLRRARRLAEHADSPGPSGAPAGVAVADGGQVGQGLVGGLDVVAAQAALLVGQGAAEQRRRCPASVSGSNWKIVERRQQRRVDGEERVLRGGPDEDDRRRSPRRSSSTSCWARLKRCSSSMNRTVRRPLAASRRAGVLDDLADFLDRGAQAALSMWKSQLAVVGDDVGQRGLAACPAGRGRPGCDSRSASSIRRSILPGPRNSSWPSDLVDGPRPHAHGQRGMGGHGGVLGLLEQVHGHTVYAGARRTAKHCPFAIVHCPLPKACLRGHLPPGICHSENGQWKMANGQWSAGLTATSTTPSGG